MKIGLFLLFTCLLTPAATAQTDTTFFFVAPTGKPNNPGTKTRPFASPEQARDAIRKHRVNQPGNCYTVYFQKGTYQLEAPFELTAADSGQVNCPVRYAAYPGDTVLFYGGRRLDPAQFKPTTNPAVLRRLPPESRGSVVEINLKKQGISNYGQLTQHGFGRIPEPSPLELFIHEKRQPLARYPNTGKLLIGKIHDPGSIAREGDSSARGACFGYEYDRPGRWLEAPDAWLYGRFSYGFCDDHLGLASIDTAEKTITTAHPHIYGVFPGIYVDTSYWREMAGHSIRGYFVYNLLEEMDQPGEWYLDRQSGLLYLFPPADFLNALVEISITEQPFFRLLNTAHVRIEDIRFSTARGMGIYLENAHHITIENCTFSNLGTVAISAGQPLQHNRQGFNKEGSPLLDDWRSENFHHLNILNCRISNTGTGGIILTGGDRRTLVSSENVVRNCRFSRTDVINRTYAPAVKVEGVGTTISHCTFSDQNHMALALDGNEHRIENNRFERICTDTDDMGAIYTGRDPSARGTVIRHNHFRDILPGDKDSQVAAIFLDDGTGGIDIGHNYFERVGSQGDKELFGAVSIHGGYGNTVHHNVFQDCEVAIGNNYWLDERWNKFLASPLIQQRLFEQVNINSAVYREKYPELQRYFTGSEPRLNKVAENVLINSNMVLNGFGEFFWNHLVTEDRLRYALEKIEFRLDDIGPEH
ncbi:MAG: right-handed parallel beta-helix repeat-containing protein [Lewinellaceae bacterium]|nr:right-handed parallel beta-helix repeat-containing protein [Lewinellaceae bacterium]